MSFSEEGRALEQSFAATRELLRRLLAELQQRRAAWISVRPDVLAPSPTIEQLSQELALEDDRRNTLLAALRPKLPAPPGIDADSLHVNVTRIAAALPRDRGRALIAAADEVRTLAKLVRTEVTLGQRLLRFAQRTQTEFAPALAAAAGARAAPGYDRRARSVAGPAAGRLVDGRI